MPYINNMNPRRMIWFNQNAPKNKMDLWLSYNRHYEDTSEDETVDPQQVDDNPNQRKCDLILKAWDCGQWVPIVGFNTTAANKIDTVEGNTLYHPAIFTGENPNDLYDAGTLGSLLSDTNFVTEEEWYDVFNSTDYNWSDIFGDTNWFGDLIWETIQGGSSTYHLPWATTEVCGGILSDIHTYDAVSAFKPIEVKFYPTTNAYSSKLHRLCVSASDVIQQINSYYNDNPGGSSININWNSTTIHQLAEVLQDILKNSSSLEFEGDVWSLASDPHVYPHIWGVSSSNAGKFLRINPQWNDEGNGWSQSNNNMDWVDIKELLPDLINQGEMFIPADGISIAYVAPHGDDLQYVKWGLNHIGQATDGQFCRKVTNNGVVDIEWVDIQGGTEYTPGTGIDIQNDEISIDMTGAQADNVLVATSSSSVGWAAITHPTYTSTNAQIVTFTGNDDPGYVLHLKPNCRYYCTSQIQAITLYSYSTPIFVPSIIELVTSDKPLLRFDSSYDFIETYTTNSTSYSQSFSYDSTYNLYTIALKPETRYIVTINGNKISVDEISDKDTLFNVQ